MKGKKRQMHPKLPNGFGSIKWLGRGRRNPYGVYPPMTDTNDEGVPITPKALCYVDDWYKGFSVLLAYKAGTYYKGFEETICFGNSTETENLDAFIQQMLADYNRIKGIEQQENKRKKTFSQV